MSNGVPTGCTGRGRGMARGGDLGLGRSRGRGISEFLENEIPGLNLNGNRTAYKADARTALETVTSKSKNTTEVLSVLNKWLDLAESNEEIGEAVATSACNLMTQVEYGDKIREVTLGRIFSMFKECSDQKIQSPSILSYRFSFIGYMYLIQRQPDTHKRFDFYVAPLILYIKEFLKHRLTEEGVKLLTKQIALNGIALSSTPEGRQELTTAFTTIRSTLYSDFTDSKLRPYLHYLCDLQAFGYQPLPADILKYYTIHIPEALLDSYKPLEIDLKLYANN